MVVRLFDSESPATEFAGRVRRRLVADSEFSPLQRSPIARLVKMPVRQVISAHTRRASNRFPDRTKPRFGRFKSNADVKVNTPGRKVR